MKPIDSSNNHAERNLVKSSDDPTEYANALKKVRKHRMRFFSTVLIYIPALIATYLIIPTDRAMGTVFCTWFVLLLATTLLAALCRCPRCGNLFHVNGMALLFLRKCLHCQLHINADKAATASAPEQQEHSDSQRQ